MKNPLKSQNKLSICTIVIVLLFSSCSSDAAVEQQQDVDTFPQVSASSSNSNASSNVQGLNFIPAAKAVTPGVVHIKTTYQQSRNATGYGSPYEARQAPGMGSGSGVVISTDGYIATNNHVIENATNIEVIFPNRRTYAAKLIGRDPSTDLALLKVDATDLPMVTLGNSDDLEVGAWVLAVGYPFSLNTTVTAGIVSAKSRSIGIINNSLADSPQSNSAIESFIQTDAAINPGNSGGALVDFNGRLVGINTAIASLTGSYAGYAFAVPVNLAKKILDDLRQFGEVRRGLLGVSFPAPATEIAYLKQQGIDPGSIRGVIITGIQKGSAAQAAGLKEGDIIQSIDGTALYSSAEFSERVARRRPGDEVKLTYLRDGKTQTTTARLQADTKETLATNQPSVEELNNKLGAVFSPLSPAIKERLNIGGGVVVSKILIGGFFNQLGIPPGSIIVYINGQTINRTEDIYEALVAAQNSRVQVLGIAPDGSKIAFNFSLGT
ncbi:MAG: trypsin-like peptidase domain-containing protein [Daejeonella sp.]|uniref:trypsin-like peptidase domain-containing protein n=1 Tax=Daejeonella sp. TaxID=2805397 RepID=UPI003C74D684